MHGNAGASKTATPRIYHLHLALAPSSDDFGPRLDRIARMGFSDLLLSEATWASLDGAAAELARLCRERGLRLLADLDLGQSPGEASPEDAGAACGAWEGPVDPRRLGRQPPDPWRRLGQGHAGVDARALAWSHLRPRLQAGVGGFRLVDIGQASPDLWRELIAEARRAAPGLFILADPAGARRETVQAMAGCGFDRLLSSLPWWDGRARWLVEEYEALRTVAPLVAPLESPSLRLAARLAPGADIRRAYRARLTLAAATGSGLLAPEGFECGARGPRPASDEPPFDLCAEIRIANAVSGELGAFAGEMRLLTSAGAPVTAILRADRPDAREAEHGLLILANPGDDAAAPRPSEYMDGAGADFGPFEPLGGGDHGFEALAPGEVRLLLARRARPIRLRTRAARTSARAAAEQPRIVIESVSPRVDGGDFAVKRIVGERVVVEADVFAEGHTGLAAELLARPADRDAWRAMPMTPLGNDRWSADFELDRMGRWEFAIEAWIDVFGAYAEGLAKKIAAGVAESVDFEEGRALVEAAASRAGARPGRALAGLLARLKSAPDEARAALLVDPETALLMRQADARPWRRRSEVQAVEAERLSARFASWYELFPRSQSDSPAQHGTFDDVIARLPDIRAMGFDVLYFPPIHPIGRKGRKGRDNSLAAQPDDPGSPYAIGGAEGGHTDIHPELGTLEDFRRLLAAAREHGLEIALDFAIQCSPDHPWLKERPGWFDWRPDGSLKYAENPPKRYEDIVNVDFYARDAVPDLWCALRDVVLFWAREGVRIFRVDNPHTKPLPFWEWMIADVRRAHPDVIFLAEAFTRPKLMYRLAKLGFSQSYTYFTWRHTKQELTDYLTELTTEAPKEFFRPHFFVNTPDINPYFLQTSGRAGFLIRAALAATLSGLWGVYSGFELLEADPMPGKEEYRRSEKYEIKPRDWNAPGAIKADIARLNRIRKGEPALQTHLGVRFYNAFNDQVLYFGKPSPGARDMILVAVSLDPHAPQAADFEVPLWEWELPDDAALEAFDLVRERRLVWRGKRQHLSLTPEAPYAIWRVQPAAAV